jgi:hypothetical protein
MQEFNELVYWPQKENPPLQFREIRTVGWGPFKRTSRMLDNNQQNEMLHFRLPNFVDGISELNATVRAKVSAQFKFKRTGIQARYVDVTKEFYKNLKIIDEMNGLFESKVSLAYENNQNNNPYDDMYWRIDRVYLIPGWTYSPNKQLLLPLGYYENWTDSGYELDEEGGQKILTLWGI